MSFEIQETFLIKVADTETLEHFYDKFYISVYQRVLDFLREKNLFRFEDTQIYRGEFGDIYNYPKDLEEEFMENHNPDDEDYFFEKTRFDIDYAFTAIEEEKLLRNLKVEGFVKMYDSVDHVLNEHFLDSIDIRSIGTCIYKLLIRLRRNPTPYLENLTCKYFLKIES